MWRGRWQHIDVAVKEMHTSSSTYDKLVSLAEELNSPESATHKEAVAGVIKEVRPYGGVPYGCRTAGRLCWLRKCAARVVGLGGAFAPTAR